MNNFFNEFARSEIGSVEIDNGLFLCQNYAMCTVSLTDCSISINGKLGISLGYLLLQVTYSGRVKQISFYAYDKPTKLAKPILAIFSKNVGYSAVITGRSMGNRMVSFDAVIQSLSMSKNGRVCFSAVSKSGLTFK